MVATVKAERSPATPEKIWEILNKLTERQAEYDRRWEREIALREAETARRLEEEARRREEEAKWREEEAKRRKKEAKWHEKMAKLHEKEQEERDDLRARIAETALMIGDNDKRVGRLRNSFGELAEHLVAPGIVSRFAEIGYRFDRIKDQRLTIPGRRKGEIVTEVDILLENEDVVIAVEVKSRPRMGEYENEKDDIQHHIWRLEVLRKYRKDMGEPSKRLMGAIAGAIFDEPVKKAALEAGFFVIGQSGDTMKIEIPEGFKPREW